MRLAILTLSILLSWTLSAQKWSDVEEHNATVYIHNQGYWQKQSTKKTSDGHTLYQGQNNKGEWLKLFYDRGSAMAKMTISSNAYVSDWIGLARERMVRDGYTISKHTPNELTATHSGFYERDVQITKLESFGDSTFYRTIIVDTIVLGEFGKLVRDINPRDLDEYYRVFLILMASGKQYPYIGDVKIEFGQLPGDIIGEARAVNDPNNVEIIIDPENWIDASQPKRMWIMAHELAHDILDVKHNTRGPLMNPSVGDVTYPELEYAFTRFVASYISNN